ncbi:MAG TPA: GNAT family N-acetyltransferase [Gaiellaceae bacterium]|nr:GNAT family N-acetyltransferase [Gaiellaceae bacterium]
MSIDRIAAFRRTLQAALAERVVPTAHGTAYLSDSIPQVYDHNYLSVEDAPTDAETLADEGAAALAGCFHRRVVVESGAPGLAEDFAALGYVLSTHLVLEHRRAPDRLVDTSAIREADLDELLPARTTAILREQWGDEEIARQLNDAKRHVGAAAPTRWFAATAGDEIAGWCELRVRDGVAQIEDVEVLAEFRGLGLGRAIVQHALAEGERVAGVVFLEALADDWPRELYAKLGFVGAGRRDVYTRLPHPLTRVRLRTPRLELRAATVAEARTLFEVAKAGVHDPAVMPFAVPWTDDLDEEDFVSHVTHVSESEIRFVAFLDGQPVGVQALDGGPDGVTTGSWLGLAYQGRGLGTEMRAAVLTFAFERLGATVARSGAIDGNEQSLGVSRKLGYEVVGSHLVSPRGEPVEHTDVELRRERFVSPVPVEIAGGR